MKLVVVTVKYTFLVKDFTAEKLSVFPSLNGGRS